MDQLVQSYFANKQFMGTVLVARGGQVLVSKGYGSANLEWDIPNAPNTKFRLGSVSKQFTAAAILLLEERGKLHLSDPVKKHLPDAPAAWDPITIFHVLTHTAGIPSFTSFPDYGKIKLSATTTAELVGLFRDKPLEFEPGEKFNYSNSGYVLLTHLIEKISGVRYEMFVRENLFAPLGMNDSGYDSNAAIIPRRAAGYSPGRNGPENTAFISRWQTFMKDDLRVVNDPMEAHVMGFHLWVKGVEKAGSTDVTKVREAMKGLTVRSLSGYDVVYDGETQHLHKPVVIGEILLAGQMQTVWKSSGLVEPKPWSPYLPKK